MTVARDHLLAWLRYAHAAEEQAITMAKWLEDHLESVTGRFFMLLADPSATAKY